MMDRDQVRDMWGIAFIVVGVLTALGLFIPDSAGPVGAALQSGVRIAFGLFGLVMPVLLGAAGVMLIVDHRPGNARIVAGTISTMLSLIGLWHLAAGAPGPDSAPEQLASASGWTGVGVTLPLTRIAAVPGAAVVLTAVLLFGCVTLIGLPLRRLGQIVASAFVTDQPRAPRRSRYAYDGYGDENDDENAVGYVDEFAAEPEQNLRSRRSERPRPSAASPSGRHREEKKTRPGKTWNLLETLGLVEPSEEGNTDDAERLDSDVASDVDGEVTPGDKRYGGTELVDAAELLAIPTDDDDDHGVVQEHTLHDPSRDETVRIDDTAATERTVRLAVASTTKQDAESSTEQVVEQDTEVVQNEADAAERADLLGDDEDNGAARKLVQNPDTDYQLPTLESLQTGHRITGDTSALDEMRGSLEQMFEEFNVNANVVAVRRGPTVTRFEIELGTGVKVKTFTALEKDIAYALATPDIRIVAPIPGKVAVGIEVPNRERDHVTLGDILRSSEAEKHTHPLTAAIGVDIAGQPVLINLAKMPHLLIAGATGSGKSVVMNCIVTSLITRNTPDDVRMILIDPKRVEMTTYADVPHLLTAVVTDPKRAKDALEWTVSEMERRYELLAQFGFRNLDTYNEAVVNGELSSHDKTSVLDQDAETAAAEAVAERLGDEVEQTEEKLPYIVCIIDELSDLMMVAQNDIESAIVRISQMARAVGIHLVIATQRPSVKVVTGLIKANVPSRIALSMANGYDSKTVLDQTGAEKLIGMGDMLYMPASASKPHRLQGCYVGETEIEKIVDHCKAQAEVVYAENVVKTGQEAVMADVQTDATSDDELVVAARELVVRSGLGSTSMLQRKLKVGFARAGRLMDELEEQGVVGPSEGPKARTVLMTVDELEQMTA